MTVSNPPYQNKWRIHVEPEVPFSKYREQYGPRSYHEFLDYDGLRDGPYQKNEGWCIQQRDFINWLRRTMTELKFNESEIDSVVYHYGRLLMDCRYPEEFLVIYPQTKEIVDQSVGLSVSPQPSSVYRLWFFLELSNDQKQMNGPKLQSVQRAGFTVVELGFLTARDVPHGQHVLSWPEYGPVSGLLPRWVDSQRY